MNENSIASGTGNAGTCGAGLKLTVDSLGKLVATTAKGEHFVDVVPLRLFPLSDPDRWIALLDNNGQELSVIDDLGKLDPATRQILNQELTRREFVPVIRRIVWVSGNSEPCSWQVETDRGQTEFVLKSDDDIRRLGTNSVLVIDSHGIRYLIPDRHALDAFTRRVVEWYV